MMCDQHGCGKPMVKMGFCEDHQPRKPWPKSYLALPARYRRIINNFMSSRASDGIHPDRNIIWDLYNQNKANWAYDGVLYNFPPLMVDKYHQIRRHYIICGPISEEGK